MKTLGYYNGKIGPLDQMQVPMLDRAYYFGDGVYDVMFARNYKIYGLEEHVNRLFQSADGIGIKPAFTRQELANILFGLVKQMDDPDLWVYMQISRGTAERSHVFPTEPVPNLCVMIRPKTVKDPKKPLSCITYPDRRFAYCFVKSLNLLPNVIATEAAERAGCDESILLRGETVTECAHSNLFILKDGVAYTHPANEWIYAGTGRSHLIKQCAEFGIPVKERAFSVSELFDADEVILTSVSSICLRVLEIDRKSVGGKDEATWSKLQDALYCDYLNKTAE